MNIKFNDAELLRFVILFLPFAPFVSGADQSGRHKESRQHMQGLYLLYILFDYSFLYKVRMAYPHFY